jgi:hypothetical protein
VFFAGFSKDQRKYRGVGNKYVNIEANITPKRSNPNFIKIKINKRLVKVVKRRKVE